MIRVDVTGLANVSEKVEETVIAAMHKVGLDIFRNVVLTTPVDTGRARNGWTLDDQPDQVIVENQVPYIGVLNNGHSKQAPAGFVENAIDKATR